MDPGSQLQPLAAGSGREDLLLIRRVILREPEAEQEFLRRMRCVWRFVAYKNAQYGRALTDDEVEDVAQEALLAVWRKLPSYEGRGALEAWVYRVCLLELLARLRARDRRPRSLPEPDTLRAGPVATDPIVAERILRGLERLGAPGAEVVRLRHFEGLTFEEIGVLLRVSESTVKTRYYRSIERLRDLLADLRPDRGGSA